MNRLLAEYTQGLGGALCITFGGIHGNEEAGIKAIHQLHRRLQDEEYLNPGFQFFGTWVGIAGNIPALQAGKRYLDTDLNRIWPADARSLTALEASGIEQLEMKAIAEIVHQKIDELKPDCVYIVDLHTTSSAGGIFSVCFDDPQAIRIAQALHVPLVLGLLDSIQGTTLHYFNTQNLGVQTCAVALEAGRHNEIMSSHRMVAALINIFGATGFVVSDDIENKHASLLQAYSYNLPVVTRLSYRHQIAPDDQFQMLPNYSSFQNVEKGEWLAFDKRGEVMAPHSGYILMPLYQEQGEDGFFIVREIENTDNVTKIR